MQTIPAYLTFGFILTVALTVYLLIKAANFSRPLLAGIIAWLALQAALSVSGFYLATSGVPPRFALLLMPPIVFAIVFIFTRKGKKFTDSMNAGTLTLLHVVRIPVEIVLYLLMLRQVVPEVMTFNGRNFDILCGMTAPFVFYFGCVRKKMSTGSLIGWNLVCLLLLGNIVVTAVLSAPFRFQQFGFDHPNVALFYFPFCWLPCFVVPAALFAHLVSLRKLIKGGHSWKNMLS